jgi:hypothetical protein
MNAAWPSWTRLGPWCLVSRWQFRLLSVLEQSLSDMFPGHLNSLPLVLFSPAL